MTKVLISVLLALTLLLTPGTALAQGNDSELNLRLTRDFGYGDFTNNIQGRFSFRADGPDDLLRVEFYIDEELIATVEESPFDHQFNTDNYSPGEHRLYAIGFTSNGDVLHSNEFTRVFLSPEEARGGVVGILGPIFAILAIVMLLSFLIPTILTRGKPVKIKGYGMAGGAVCKRCGKPFARAIWMPNILVGKLARCPHCGKIAIVPRATPDQLEQAEARYRAEMDGGGLASPQESDQHRLQRQIDDSRFD